MSGENAPSRRRTPGGSGGRAAGALVAAGLSGLLWMLAVTLATATIVPGHEVAALSRAVVFAVVGGLLALGAVFLWRAAAVVVLGGVLVVAHGVAAWFAVSRLLRFLP